MIDDLKPHGSAQQQPLSASHAFSLAELVVFRYRDNNENLERKHACNEIAELIRELAQAWETQR